MNDLRALAAAPMSIAWPDDARRALRWAADLVDAAQAIRNENDAMVELRARIAKLEAELERERMKLVACGVVAGANTRDSAREARQMPSEYRSASLYDVERAVDREMAERERREAAEEALRLALDPTRAVNTNNN